VRYVRQALPLLPFLAVVLVFLVIPTGTVIVNAFVVDGRFSLDLVAALFTEAPLAALLRSVLLSASSALIGGVLGAYVLTSIDASIAKPFVLAYLAALGIYLFYRGVMHRHTERRPRVVSPLGLVGGFLDAAGGGGWGGIVTSNLLVQGSNPRKTIGTVNTAEFFLTVTISATFLATMGWQAFTVATVGLLIGGVAAAPFGAWIAKRVNPDTLLTFVGALLTLVSTYGLYRALA